MSENKNKIKIAYLLEYPLDLAGGAQMSTQSLCNGLVNAKAANGREFEVIVVCPELLKKKPEDFDFRICTYPMGNGRIKNLMMRARAFRKIISEEKPDIVHIQMPESLITYGISGIKPRKKGGPALIFTDRGLFYGYRIHSKVMMVSTLRKADLMLTTTDFNKKMWLEGTQIRPIEKVANTISDRFLAYDEAKRAEHEIKDKGVLCIGLAGRICEEKDWPFAVSLIEKAAKKGIRFRVKLVLSVFEAGDDEKVSEIVSRIGKAVGEENLEFHQDFTQDEMQEYYYGVDVFLMTSQFESFGKAAVEAMSRRCAVISTTVGGLPEVIGCKDNLYTKETVDKAIAYIEKADSDRAFLKREQEYFYKRYMDNFSQEKCLRDHIELYERVLK